MGTSNETQVYHFLLQKNKLQLKAVGLIINFDGYLFRTRCIFELAILAYKHMEVKVLPKYLSEKIEIHQLTKTLNSSEDTL